MSMVLALLLPERFVSADTLPPELFQRLEMERVAMENLLVLMRETRPVEGSPEEATFVEEATQ